MTAEIFQPFDLGDLRLCNRIVMAPMTRARNPGCIANALTAEYYAQRASAGLIVSEGTPVSPQGQGYIDVPGIWSEEHVSGWKLVTQAVHAQQGKIFAQLWHVGRMSHTSLQPNGADPVSASTRPVASSSKSFAFIYREDGTRGTAEPSPARALETEDVPGIVRDFEQAAQRAIKADFDGIEIHAANGYLFEQFLNPITNDRVDAYGGSLPNRARLILDTVDAIAARIGSRKVGIRLAPNNRQFDMPEYPESEASYLYLAEELGKRDLAYVHLNDNHANGSPDMSESFLNAFKRTYGGTVILAGRLTLERAALLIDQAVIDLAAFGQPYIANPDLVERFQKGVQLASPDRATYYGGGVEGYTDYPLAT
ncbi:alkene reductase [Xanthomonas campestris]|uniref:alkene reductase n=1 Tax=Xanthomonas campestris TaxID=339 RepID=UPI00096BD9D2|nr:alkene reductase [Xanthomonas campestris]MCF8826451.1 alkene reductase [Xanthomonas campestris pv. raphani]MEA9838931.1 alkene reductase [Xanthomonas campestris pv. raphani]MEA9878479.1 alkene reductase [Xanthomonas campestris pv. raphani]MEA9894878.1 alkene reductase [Xanthomonas campestris pv. raphani]MEA9934540.1 alkene reductase [Xanthomonas campestris pv. raphani]